jgi:hypothetical protein
LADCIIGMKSQTAAERARRAAIIEKLRADVVSVDPSVTKRGCSLGLRVNCDDVQRITALLEKTSIPYGDVIGRSGR